MHLKRRDLCGIIAIGDNFRAGGMLCFMSPHFTIFAKPPLTLSFVSLCRHSVAIRSFADMCSPLCRAAKICWMDQFGPHCTGQPLVLYDSSMADVGCNCAIFPLGHMRPDLPMSDLIGMLGGKMSVV